MQVTRCDICKKTSDKVELNFRLRRTILSERINCGISGGWWHSLDICDECYKRMKSFILLTIEE